MNKPNGLRRGGTFFIQGYVLDSGALNAQAAVTNGIVIVSE